MKRCHSLDSEESSITVTSLCLARNNFTALPLPALEILLAAGTGGSSSSSSSSGGSGGGYGNRGGGPVVVVSGGRRFGGSNNIAAAVPTATSTGGSGTTLRELDMRYAKTKCNSQSVSSVFDVDLFIPCVSVCVVSSKSENQLGMGISNSGSSGNSCLYLLRVLNISKNQISSTACLDELFRLLMPPASSSSASSSSSSCQCQLQCLLMNNNQLRHLPNEMHYMFPNLRELQVM